jgi:CRP-like cAMP-binding protein
MILVRFPPDGAFYRPEPWGLCMQRASNAKTGNRLLDAMPQESLKRIKPHLESVALVAVEPLHPAEYAYFPVSGVISVISMMSDGTTVEVGMSGREGMYCISAILGDDAPFQTAVVPLPGRAFQLKTRLLRQEMQADDALQTLLLRYVQAFVNGIAQSAACNRLHLLEQRCARWLLACHDRADGDTFPMTQEFIAMMLGVRRPGISLAAQSLKEKGLITYNHGAMTVLDRHGLEAATCECHRIIQDERDRLMAAPLLTHA